MRWELGSGDKSSDCGRAVTAWRPIVGSAFRQREELVSRDMSLMRLLLDRDFRTLLALARHVLDALVEDLANRLEEFNA